MTTTSATANDAHHLQREWAESPRWKGITRPYSAKDVVRLRGSVRIEHSLARLGAEKFWNLLHTEKVVSALGALTGNQAVEEVQAGLKAIYCSGWQVAGDGNSSGEMYPDQSLYAVDSVPKMVERINNALLRTDQIHHMEGDSAIDWLAPIIADAEAGFGGNLNAFELMKAMIRAGAAGVHFEDQLSSAKKCGHMGGKVLVPTQDAINKLVAARLAADVMGVPTVLIARTDADAANLLPGGLRRARPQVPHGQAHQRRVLRGPRRPGPGDRPRPLLRTLRGPALVRDVQARPGPGGALCQGNPREVPRQAPVLQLLAVLQLEGQPAGRKAEGVPGAAGGDGLPLPVHHAGRLARAEPVHVRAGPGLQADRHERWT